ncbi:MAG TPA: aldehyde dehydrogenase family protein [Polyangiales bacterium]|nr:aldehyde dehydrogenase family protein [Polyangiales bacterium]
MNLETFGIAPARLSGGSLVVRSPVDGGQLAALTPTPAAELETVLQRAAAAFTALRVIPAPRRGEWIRLFGEELRAHKDALGRLVSVECGKIVEEGRGEVQEMIDICEFAVGLSRQLHGLTIASERSQHRMMEQWHPLGPVGVISAFNFPVAVWAWNFALAIVCGDPVIWKPSEKTPLCALACQALWERALRRAAQPPPAHLSQVLIGGRELGEALARDGRVLLLSATGSCAMGRAVAPLVAARFGRCLLELGGNNAMLVSEHADLDLAVRAIVFAAVGTAGQRCTSLRRLIAHERIADGLCERLVQSYRSLPIGSPLESGTLVGPLIDGAAFRAVEAALEQAQREGGSVLCGGKRALADRYPDAYYVEPAIVRMPAQSAVVQRETFGPVLYVLTYRDLDQAIALHNAVEQGLSSCIFTNDLREAELFLGPSGSDCGIANVNIGTSGAEIGGAFGGEKATGGGRESGSDAWKNYMRRTTNTVNYGRELPLAQGIKFT